MAIRVGSQVLHSVFLQRDCGLVGSWPGYLVTVLHIFAVWNFRLENAKLPSRVELLLTLLVEVINAWTWMGWWFGWLKWFSFHFARGEIDFRILGFHRRYLWVVGSWAHLVHSNARIGCLSDLLARNTWSFCVGDNLHILVLLIEIFIQSLIEVRSIVPLLFSVVVSRRRVVLVRRTLNQARTWSCWAKPWNLKKK